MLWHCIKIRLCWKQVFLWTLTCKTKQDLSSRCELHSEVGLKELMPPAQVFLSSCWFLAMHGISMAPNFLTGFCLHSSVLEKSLL